MRIQRVWTEEDKAFLDLALWPYCQYAYRPKPLAWIRADGKLLSAAVPGNIDNGMKVYPLFGQPYRSLWKRLRIAVQRHIFNYKITRTPKPAVVAFTPKVEIETAQCTLCSSEDSDHFYTGCMIKDKATTFTEGWDCDGKGNLTRPKRGLKG